MVSDVTRQMAAFKQAAGIEPEIIPSDPKIYEARLRRIQAIVNEVDNHYGWPEREVYGEPGKLFCYNEACLFGMEATSD
jgi:hypothetical protein